MMTRIATCSCQSLRAEVSGDPIRVTACHCDQCQRRTGSVFGVGAYYKKEQVQISGPNPPYSSGGKGRMALFKGNNRKRGCAPRLFHRWDLMLEAGVGGFGTG